MDLEQALATRYSARKFLSRQVETAVIERILELAQRTASWCNSQPWQLVVTRGAATDRFRDALLAHAYTGAGAQPDFAYPERYEGEVPCAPAALRHPALRIGGHRARRPRRCRDPDAGKFPSVRRAARRAGDDRGRARVLWRRGLRPVRQQFHAGGAQPGRGQHRAGGHSPSYPAFIRAHFGCRTIASSYAAFPSVTPTTRYHQPVPHRARAHCRGRAIRRLRDSRK